MIRLIGADSGLTIEMIRFAETILPNPMLISLIAIQFPYQSIAGRLQQSIQMMVLLLPRILATYLSVRCGHLTR